MKNQHDDGRPISECPFVNDTWVHLQSDVSLIDFSYYKIINKMDLIDNFINYVSIVIIDYRL